MNQQVATLGLELPHTRPRVIYYVALVKPRVLTMILVATFYWPLSGLNGTFRSAPGAGSGTGDRDGGRRHAFAQSIHGARSRCADGAHASSPPAGGNLHPAEALWFGIALAAAGFAYLYFAVNGPCAAVTGAITVTYLAIYTPLKRVSSLCTAVGAIPGALPPVAGWAATRGSIGAPAWILFAVIYLWQLPHTLAIAQLYRDDYNRAGIHLLGTEDPDGRATGGQMVINTLVLMVVALLPTLFGFAGLTYFVVALAMGGLLLSSEFQFAASPGRIGARRVMIASLIYLPVLLLLMVLDKILRTMAMARTAPRTADGADQRNRKLGLLLIGVVLFLVAVSIVTVLTHS